MYSAGDKSSTACYHCRRQKIRCSRDLPLCTRCSKHQLTCDYPEPPDRRQIANFRRGPVPPDVLPRVIPESQDSSSLGAHGTLANHPSWDPGTSTPPDPAATVSGPGASFSNLRNDAIPPSEIGVFLLETYFGRIFNASFLFHQPSFTNDYRRGNVKEHVYLSIFAVASLFIRNHPVSSLTKDPGLSNPTIYHSGRCWAERASIGALQHADSGGLDVIQSCENLALYWWAVGEPRRGHFHSMASYAACQMLGLETMCAKPTSWSEFTFELNRRCFWACWIKQCVHDTPSLGVTRLRSIPKLQLPCDDAQFGNLVPFKEPNTPKLQTLSDVTPRATSCEQSASLVRLFTIWVEIKSAVYSRFPSDSHRNVGQVFELDKRVRQLDALLPALKEHNEDIFFNSSKSMLFFAAYHQCFLLLHASITPAFSTRKSDDTSPLLAEVASRTLLTSTTAITSFITIFLARNLDITKVPSFAGYCAFTCGVIHLVLYRMTSHESFSACVQVSILFLRELAAYWPAFYSKYQHLQNLARPQILVPSSPPRYDPETHDARIEEMCIIGSRALSHPAAIAMVPSVLRSLPMETTYISSSDDGRSAMPPLRDTEYIEAIDIAHSTSSAPMPANGEPSFHPPVVDNIPGNGQGQLAFTDSGLAESLLDREIFDLLFSGDSNSLEQLYGRSSF